MVRSCKSSVVLTHSQWCQPLLCRTRVQAHIRDSCDIRGRFLVRPNYYTETCFCLLGLISAIRIQEHWLWVKVVIWYNLLSINVCESQRNLSVFQHIKTHSKHQKLDLQKYSANLELPQAHIKTPLCYEILLHFCTLG